MKLINQLHENLIGTKHLHGLDWDELSRKLEQNGFTRAHGAYADVWWHPKWNYVYKVFERDNAYLAFLEFCSTRQHNPHLPKILKRPFQIHAIHDREQFVGDKLWAVKTERLQHLPPNMMEFFNYKFKQMVFSVRSGIESPNPAYFSGSKYAHLSSDELSWDMLWEIFQHIDLKGLVYTAIQIMSNVKGVLDLHGNNIMMRQDGTYVITDPLYEMESISIPDFRSLNKFRGSHKSGPVYNK